MTTYYTTFESPIGELLLTGDGRSLTGLYMQEGRTAAAIRADWVRDDDAFADTRAQLDEYFTGGRTKFDLPLEMAGSPFQVRVWSALRDIPYGETISYGELARRVGAPATPRNVGATNGRNPIAVIVPCHRVIGADGSLTGYGGGLERKRTLLDLEAGVLVL
jgi:methylated-DNA-[protein]-cysteine S-methyltransferase